MRERREQRERMSRATFIASLKLRLTTIEITALRSGGEVFAFEGSDRFSPDQLTYVAVIEKASFQHAGRAIAQQVDDFGLGRSYV